VFYRREKKNYQNVTVGVLNLGTPNLFTLPPKKGIFLFVTLYMQLSRKFYLRDVKRYLQ